MSEEIIREAFEAFYREHIGAPSARLRSGLETVPADYSDPFLWFDEHPVHTEFSPQYYYGDIQQKYVFFKAGWAACLRGARP